MRQSLLQAGEMGSQALICVYLFRVIRFAGALTEPQTLLCFVHRSLSWPRDQSVDQCRLLPNKRLKLTARVDYGMNLSSARRSLSAIR